MVTPRSLASGVATRPVLIAFVFQQRAARFAHEMQPASRIAAFGRLIARW